MSPDASEGAAWLNRSAPPAVAASSPMARNARFIIPRSHAHRADHPKAMTGTPMVTTTSSMFAQRRRAIDAPAISVAERHRPSPLSRRWCRRIRAAEPSGYSLPQADARPIVRRRGALRWEHGRAAAVDPIEKWRRREDEPTSKRLKFASFRGLFPMALTIWGVTRDTA